MMRGHYAYYGITGNSRRLSWYAYDPPIAFHADDLRRVEQRP
jgi:hypothetical protein